MSGVSSRHGLVGLARQTAQGVPALTPQVVFFLAGTPSLTPIKDRQRLAETDSDRDVGDPYTSQLRVEGDIPFYARPDGIALPFYLALGDLSTTGGGPYAHEITGADDVPFCSIWYDRGGSSGLFEHYYDCKVNTLQLEGQAGSPFMGTMSIIGMRAWARAQAMVGTALSSQPLLYPEVFDRLKFGGTARRSHRVAWSVTNGLSGYQSDDFHLTDIDPGGREFTLSAGFRFQGPSAFPDYLTYFQGALANEVQTVTITGTPTGGDFTLTFLGQETAAIAYNAAASAVQSALEALSNIGVGDVVCAGGALPGTPVTVTFQGALAHINVPALVADDAGLTGGSSPAVTVTTTTPGNELTPVVATTPFELGIWRSAALNVLIEHPEVSFAGFPVQADPGGAPIEIDLTCEVERESGGGPACTVTVVDGTASY